MRRFVKSVHRPSLWVAIIVPLLVFALACGPGEEATPTPTTAAPTPTTEGPVATPTTPTGPVATPTTPTGPVATPTRGPIATPTATREAVPTPVFSGTPVRGGKVTLGSPIFLPDWDIQVTLSNADYWQPGGKVYNNLMYHFGDGKGAFYDVCEICSDEGWHLENAGKTMVFNLRPGIKFSNGKELTSADVKYSIRKMMGEIDGIPGARVGILKNYIESIDAPSPYVLRINLIRPSPYLPKVLSMAPAAIYPEGTARAALKTPVGTGPYLLKSSVPGTSHTLVRNPNYWKPGLPYMDEIEVQTISDSTARILQFLGGKTAFTMYGEAREQYVPQLRQLQSEGKVRLLDGGPCGLHGVYFQMSKPPFGDNLKLRQAANLALDRKVFGQLTLPAQGGGVEHLLHFNEMTGSPFATPNSQIWDVVPGWGTGAKKQQEIAQAKQLMIEAGHPTGLDVKYISGADPGTAGQATQQQLGAIGIRMTFDINQPAAWGERMINLDWMITHYVYWVVSKDPDEVLGTYFTTGGSRNWFGYSNQEVDRLYLLMSAELDVAKRAQLYKQVANIVVVDDVMYAPVPGALCWYWSWNWLKGYEVARDGNGHAASQLNRGETWWLDPTAAR